MKNFPKQLRLFLVKLAGIGALLLFALPAPAEPVTLAGRWVPSGKIQSSLRQVVDVVDARQPGAAEHLEAIKKAGGQCEQVTADVNRCVTNMPGGVPESSLRKLAAQNSELWIEFAQAQGAAQLVSSGALLKTWMIPQAGRWTHGQFESIRYLELHSAQVDAAKLVVTGEQSELWLNVSGSRLLFNDTVIVNESRWRWYEDSAEIELAPQVAP